MIEMLLWDIIEIHLKHALSLQDRLLQERDPAANESSREQLPPRRHSWRCQCALLIVIQAPSCHWPPEFYANFTSCVWITYRAHFHPIRDSSLTVLEREQAEVAAAVTAGSPIPISSSPPSKWWWPGGEKGWMSDA